MVDSNRAILTGLGSLVSAEPQLRSRGTPRPREAVADWGVGWLPVGDFARGGVQRCATYLIKGHVGQLAWQTVAEGLLRRIAHVLSSRRLWGPVAPIRKENEVTITLVFIVPPHFTSWSPNTRCEVRAIPDTEKIPMDNG